MQMRKLGKESSIQITTMWCFVRLGLSSLRLRHNLEKKIRGTSTAKAIELKWVRMGFSD